MGFLKPTKFKIIFTLFMVLIGASLIWFIFNIPGVSQWYGFKDFLNFLFGHFYYVPAKLCSMSGPGPSLDTSCFFTRFFITLIVQIIFYYLLASLIEFFYRKLKKFKS